MLALVAGGLAAEPSTFEARKAHVRTLLEQQDYGAAILEAGAINREWPDDVVGYQLLAEAHLGIGNYTEAEKAIQWMLDLRIGKADSSGWLLVARFREVTGDIEGAIEAANLSYSRLQPSQGGERLALLSYLARLHLLAGRSDVAEQALRAPLTESPANPEALRTLAEIRLAQNKRLEAVPILRDLARLTNQPRDLYLLAEATKDPTDFALFVTAAEKRASTFNNANRELALYYAGPGNRPAEAVRIARLESERRHDVFTMAALAVGLSANGKSAEAREVMKSVLAVGTRDSGIREHARRIGVK
jgi:predicted Zn-dependent protease